MKVYYSLLVFSIFMVIVTASSRLIILIRDYPINFMTTKNFTIGFFYDLMNMSIVSIILSFILMIFKNKLFLLKIVFGFLCLLLFLDYNYYLQFGTHLPYKSIYYISNIKTFYSSITSIILSISFLLIFLLPITMIYIILKKISRLNKDLVLSNKKLFMLIISYSIVGSISGSYSNSALEKNINDPVTIPFINYFIWSKKATDLKKISMPFEDIEFVGNNLSGSKSDIREFDRYPLVRVNDSKCGNRDLHQKIICNNNSKINWNIILILMESFRATDIGVYGSSNSITPKFDELSKEGIFFKNFYANGHQTKHGEVAIYCSIMPNYGGSVMDNFPMNSFYCLPEFLKEKGYSTSWIHASDSSFDGQAIFLLKNGFDKIIDRKNFSKDAEKLGWGFTDKELFSKVIEEIRKEKQPFFTSILTITNHHPFDVHQEYNLNLGSREVHKFMNTLYYSDEQLGIFIEKAKKENWYDNTIIVITSDTSWHGESIEKANNYDEFVRIKSKIPLLIIGGPIHKPTVVGQFGSQIDIAPTLTDMLNFSRITPWMGVSFFEKHSNSFALTNRPGMYWSVMNAKGSFHLENDKIVHSFGGLVGKEQRDYEKFGRAFINTSKWLLQENLYWPTNNEKYN